MQSLFFYICRMSLKKYIGTIIVLLVLLGIANQQQADVHNQEILLEFNEANVSEVDAEVTIAILKEELQHFGVKDFRVVDDNNGKLKITYYSNADVFSVKRILLKKIRSELNTSDDEDAPFSVPFEDNDVAYNLEVHEIQKGNTSNSGLNGIAVAELNTKTDRFSKPKILVTASCNSSKKANVSFKEALRTYRNTFVELNDTLQHIPEVRAGPCC